MKILITTIVILLLAVGLLIGFRGSQILGGTLGVTSRACSVNTVTSVEVGPTTSNGVAIILSAYSNRAWARIQTRPTTTPTTYLSFDEGASAILSHGLAIGGVDGSEATPNGTSTPAFIDFGLNTDFPYVGAVTGINSSAASTSVLVTECRF